MHTRLIRPWGVFAGAHRLRMARGVFIWLLLVGVGFGITGCDSASSGAPAVVICGKTLWSGAAGALSYSAVTPGVTGPATVNPPGGPPTVIRFVSGCKHGVSITTRPRGLIRRLKTVSATNGGSVAVSVIGAVHHGGHGILVAHRPDESTTRVKLEVVR